jgi:hypothetical protein
MGRSKVMAGSYELQGPKFIEHLIELGLVPEYTTQVVIDVQVDNLVQIYYSVHGDMIIKTLLDGGGIKVLAEELVKEHENDQSQSSRS